MADTRQAFALCLADAVLPQLRKAHHFTGSNRANTTQLFPIKDEHYWRQAADLSHKGLHPVPGVLGLLYVCRPCVQWMHTRFIVS